MAVSDLGCRAELDRGRPSRTRVEATGRGLDFRTPSRQADEGRIDESGLVTGRLGGEEPGARVVLADGLLEAAHVTVSDAHDEARVAPRAEVGGVGPGGRLLIFRDPDNIQLAR